MIHTERYIKLKKLAILTDNLSKTIDKMAFNEDLPIFNSELESCLKATYHDLSNNISQLKHELNL